MMRDRRKGALALVLALWLCVTGAAAQTEWTEVPQSTLWQESADWEHHEAGLDVWIRQVSEDGVTYFLCDVLCDPGRLTSATCAQVGVSAAYAKVSALAEKAGAVLAINGDDYRTHKTGIVIRAGERLRAKTTTRHTLALYPDGRLAVFRAMRADATSEALTAFEAAGVTATWNFGPILVEDGAAADMEKFSLISTGDTRRDPRTAIGQVGEGHYLIVVADGRRKDWSKGMTIPELQAIFLRYGAETAFNLDGGGSTTLWFEGNVLNRPSGGRERVVSDILYLK